jgi:DegV family protein with EDD domain
MNSYVIITDGCADLPRDLANKMGIGIIPVTVTIDDQAPQNNETLDVVDFYRQLRDKAQAKTAATGMAEFCAFVEPYLNEGKDVLYLAFSSGLSSTYNSARLGAEELKETYPDRKVEVIDTKCASLGEGLIVYLTAKEKEKRASFEEAAQFARENAPRLCHWFTVDDLFFLKRGGRVSGATALLGTMLAIKPVLHVDDEGHLINVEKAKGRKKAIQALLDHMKATAINVQEQTIFISHGDCAEEANALAEQIKAELGVKEVLVSYIGPVIGAHSGPGTVALFFLGTER